MKLTPQQITEKVKKIEDKTLGIAERKKAYKELQDDYMNPREQFDPKTFDPAEGDPEYEVKKRERIQMQKRLPHLNMHPKKIVQGQMIGMYESKQDLYLMIAWLSERVSDLEDKLENMK